MNVRYPTIALLLAVGIGLVAWGSSGSLRADDRLPERPNIVVFLVDDMGWQDTSVAFGPTTTEWNKSYRTPNMERLAREGVLFTDAYAACCVCSPTRTSLMTGRSPARTRITNWTSGLKKMDGNRLMTCPPDWRMAGLQPEDGFPKLPGLLAELGYVTIHSGKAHFGAASSKGADPTNLGFQVNIAGSRHGSPAGYHPNPKWLQNHPGLEAYQGTQINLNDAITLEANKAVNRALQQGKPFFLHLAHYAVHAPIQAIPPYVDRYRAAGLPDPEARYASLIESMDASLGAVLANLQQQGVLRSTVILFLSDNGGLSNHSRATTGGRFVLDRHNTPLRAGKGCAYEGGTRIPMIAWWPGHFPAAKRVSNPVITMDLFDTVLELAGMSTDAIDALDSDGQSLAALLHSGHESDGPAADRPLFWHYPHQWYGDIGKGDGIEPHSSVRAGRHKLYYFYSDRRWELYDLEADLSETQDLVRTEPEVAARLAALLVERMRSVEAQLPIDRKSGAAVPFPSFSP